MPPESCFQIELNPNSLTLTLVLGGAPVMKIVMGADQAEKLGQYLIQSAQEAKQMAFEMKYN